MTNKRIAVFLSSHEGLKDSYQQAAMEIGRWIGVHKHTLVYGGARKGLMEILARSTKVNGGRVIGVVPQILEDNHLVSDNIDITFRCADLNDRKAIMVRESDFFIALPGGIGTLDEIFTILAANTIGIHHKQVILYNVDNCWTTTMTALHDLCQQNLVNEQAMSSLHVINSIDELQQLFEKF